MTLLVREAEVERLVSMTDIIAAVEHVERAYALGQAIHNPRERVRLARGMLHLMSGGLVEAELVGFKAYTAFARGPVRFKVFLYHGQTGVLEAIVEGSRLGQLRTGAATAAAARKMARGDASVVGLIGTGFQAAGQLEALACVLPLLEVRVFGRDPERRRAFAQAASERFRVAVTPVESAQAAAAGADVVVTATSAREPVLEGDWLAPGSFVAAIGANLLARREIDSATLRRADRIVVDSVAQARRESGALVLATDAGQVRWEQVGELHEVVAGRRPGRERAEEVTLFHSLGSVLWDVAAAALVWERARSAGVGERLPLD
jgi:ornithine cyclodeaminase